MGAAILALPAGARAQGDPPAADDRGAGATDTASADADIRDEASGRDGPGAALILLIGGGVVIVGGALAMARSRKRQAETKE
jgi:hypothetical protein